MEVRGAAIVLVVENGLQNECFEDENEDDGEADLKKGYSGEFGRTP